MVIFPILVKFNLLFAFIPAILLLIFVLLWPYIQLTVFVLRMIKNTIVNSYKLFRGKAVEGAEEIPLKGFLIKLNISFLRGVIDFIGLFLILVSLIACGGAFAFKQFNESLFSFYIVFYSLGFLIIMFSRYLNKIIKRKNQSTQNQKKLNKLVTNIIYNSNLYSQPGLHSLFKRQSSSIACSQVFPFNRTSNYEAL